MTNPTGSSEINLAAPQQPAPEPISDDTSDCNQEISFLGALLSVAASVGLAFTTVGLVNDWNGMRTTTVTTAVSASQALGRLNLLLPSTTEARAGCRALGGVSTWGPKGLAVHTLEGGYCSYMRPPEADYLLASHQGAEVIYSFPGRELPRSNSEMKPTPPPSGGGYPDPYSSKEGRGFLVSWACR